jgi:hypothetical protein
MRTTPILLLLLAAGCTTFAAPTQKRMTFASMQALNPGVDGEWILSEYPYAREVVRRPSGRLQSLGYWVEDPQGKSRPLMLHFDARGVLQQKQYGGPVVRPPPPTELESPLHLGG